MSSGDNVTVLEAIGGRYAKTVHSKGIRAYNDVLRNRVHVYPVPDLAGWYSRLVELAKDPHRAVIRGRFVGDEDAGALLLEEPDAAKFGPGEYPRRGRSGFFVGQAQHLCMIDVDKFPMPEGMHLPRDMEAAALMFIKTVLPVAFHGCSFVLHLSGSAGHPEKGRDDQGRELFKAHLWFWLETRYTSAEMRAWGKTVPGIDLVVFGPTQLHYTADPVFLANVRDPLNGHSRHLMHREPDRDVVRLVIPGDVRVQANAAERAAELGTPPDEKPGLVGAFCRAYPPARAVMEACEGMYSEGRDKRHFTMGGHAPDGVFITDDDLHIVSMHDSAPTGQGRRRNAWHWVRLNRWGILDAGLDGKPLGALPSQRKMIAYARSLVEVMAESWPTAEEDFADFLNEEADDQPHSGTTTLSRPAAPPALESPVSAAAAQAVDSKPTFRRWKAAELRNRAPMAWLVRGLLPRAGVACLFGDSNIGKSFAVLDIAMAVARGVPFAGMQTEQGAVLYVAAEGGYGMGKRLAAYAIFHGGEVAAFDDVPFQVVDEGIDLRNGAADAKKVVNTARGMERDTEHPIALVIIDTLARAMAGGNENAPEDMGAILRATDAIARATGALVLLVHHTGKDDSKGARGHSSLRAGMDTQMLMRKTGYGAGVLSLDKQRDGETDWTRGYRLEAVVVGEDKQGVPDKSAVFVPASTPRASAPEPRHLTLWQQRALDALQAVEDESGGMSGGLFQEIKAEAMSRAKERGESTSRVGDMIRRALTELVARGLLDKTGAGRAQRFSVL